MRNVAVLGGGSWGTALAVHLARIGHTVRLWARDPALVAEMRTRRANPVYLARHAVSRDADGHRPARRGAGRCGHGGRRRAVARPARGRPAGRRARRRRRGRAQRHQGARGRLAAADVGGAGRGVAARARSWRCCRARASPPSSPARCRPSSSSRRAATTPSAACRRTSAPARCVSTPAATSSASSSAARLKNVMAIAAGVVEGMRLGHNARAALITRGLAEMSRLAVAAGGDRETLAGLAGMGDLVLTCTGSLSRNRHVGLALAEGRPSTTSWPARAMVAEGVRTTHAALALGARSRRRAADCRAGGRAAAGTHHRRGRGRRADGPSPAGRVRRRCASGRARARRCLLRST